MLKILTVTIEVVMSCLERLQTYPVLIVSIISNITRRLPPLTPSRSEFSPLGSFRSCGAITRVLDLNRIEGNMGVLGVSGDG